MNLQSLSASQTSPEVPINENFDVLDWATVYAKDPTTTSGLTWGYFGGRWGGTLVTAGTLSLTGGSPTTANYIVVNRSSGAISVSTSATNWNDTANYARVYKVTATGAAVESIEDHRAGPNGVIGDVGPAGTNGTNGTNGIVVNLSPETFCARLTLATGSAVPAADQIGKGTVYLTPYKGNLIALYENGSPNGWYGVTFAADLSLSVPATTNTMYDVFLYNNAGTLTLEAVAWTDDSNRATALVLQDGVYVKSGATHKRYVGSFRTTVFSGTTDDSERTRYLWNYYHRVRKNMRRVEATDTWNYTTNTWRVANGGGSPDNDENKLDFVVGVDEDVVEAQVIHHARNTNANVGFSTGIGIDVRTAPSGLWSTGRSFIASALCTMVASWTGRLAAGRHQLFWIEISDATGTTTFAGDNGTTHPQSGIRGTLFG